jgi:uncharacterized protein
MQPNGHEENQSVHSRRGWVDGRRETLWTDCFFKDKIEIMKQMNDGEDHYVYCYIDPRNLEIFYYGKGTGDRSKAHINEAQGKFEKGSTLRKMTARIKDILDAGTEPDIKVIATRLTQDQAFLVEAALIWKSNTQLVNAISGHYQDKFRPKDTLHKKLAGFDFSHGIHFFNVGEGEGDSRSWNDCYAYEFLSTGYGSQYKKQALQLHEGDVALAYLSQYGYVGVGRVIAEAVPSRDFRIGKKRLKEISLHASNMCHHPNDLDMCEYVIRVKWLVKKKRENALKDSGLFHAVSTRVKMTNQPKTLRFIEEEWGVQFDKILEGGNS